MGYYSEMISRGAPVAVRTTNAGHSLSTTNLQAWQDEIKSLMG
jgi:hypothetical protein